METLRVLQVNIPTPNVINLRPDTPCTKFPDDDAKAHCHCSASEHVCGFCDEKW